MGFRLAAKLRKSCREFPFKICFEVRISIILLSQYVFYLSRYQHAIHLRRHFRVTSF